MKKSKMQELSDELLQKKKSKHLKLSIILLLLAAILFYLGLEAVREPNMFGEIAPNPWLFNIPSMFLIIIAGSNLGLWFSTKKEIDRRV